MDIQFNSGTRSLEFSPQLVGGTLCCVIGLLERKFSFNGNDFVVGFASACTAGILLPLQWTIGIRLDKEDELLGLDRTGKTYSF